MNYLRILAPFGPPDTVRFYVGREGTPGVETSAIAISTDSGPTFGNVGIGADDPQAKLDVAGAIRIRGVDLAEPFAIAESESPEPGLVVAIDPEHPGQLRIATKAYDRTVAGVISGAGGINPGLILHQDDGLVKGDHPVTLTGRVYVWADASHGPIQSGDLLTTSDTPGHAWIDDKLEQVSVNISAAGTENGSRANPFNTVLEGINGVPTGGIVRIAPGTYREALTINRAMKLRSSSTVGAVTIGQ